MEEWARVIHDSRYTLYPVCRDSTDNIIGILNAKDYFRLDDKSRENVVHYPGSGENGPWSLRNVRRRFAGKHSELPVRSMAELADPVDSGVVTLGKVL